MKTKNKTNKIVLLSIISFVLLVCAVFGVLKLSGAWFTDTEILQGYLEVPYLTPINLQDETINNNKIVIQNASDLNKVVKLKFGNEINVDYFVLRFTVGIEVGRMESGTFVPALDFAGIGSVQANVNMTNFALGDPVSSSYLSGQGLNAAEISAYQAIHNGYYYHKNLIEKDASDVYITLINGFTDPQNLLSQGYVFQISIQSNVAVPGANSFNAFSQESGEGTAKPSWISNIQSQVDAYKLAHPVES